MEAFALVPRGGDSRIPAPRGALGEHGPSISRGSTTYSVVLLRIHEALQQIKVPKSCNQGTLTLLNPPWTKLTSPQILLFQGTSLFGALGDEYVLSSHVLTK